MSEYVLHIVGQGCLLAALAVSLNLLAGYCGLVSLGQLTFYAIGAYGAALLAGATPLGYALALPAALVVAAVVAVVQAWATSALKDDDFAIATFAMHALFWMLLMNWVDVTRGPLGIANIPPMRIFGYAFDAPSRFFILPIVLLGVALLAVWQIDRNPFGKVMRMVKDDEELAEVYGRDVKRLRRSVWSVAAIIACCAGVLQASYQGYVHPVAFSSMESAVLLAIVIIGGPGSLWGPLLGAALITCVPEALRFVGFPVAQAANIRQILLGAVLVAVIYRVSFARQKRRLSPGRPAP